MGLAATQARYLGLTARKTNIEFEGQQVNQQRMVLANESAGIYRELYSLNVPTPPNVTDFYKTEYTYKGGNTTYKINSWKNSSTSKGKYNVNVSYDKETPVGIKSFANGTITADTGTKYNITINSKTYSVDTSDTSTSDVIDKARGASSAGTYYTYTDNVGGNIYYIEKEWFDSHVPIATESEIQRYYESIQTSSVTEYHDGCSLSFDSTGGISQITDPEVSETSLSVSATSTKDDVAYEKAMNEYTVKKSEYEKVLSELNARTEKIQSEDRSLELKLKQLDTEQETLSTELEALKSVLNKNIEKVFKVFA